MKGTLHDFGRVEKGEAALELWLEQKDDLLAGRKSEAAVILIRLALPTSAWNEAVRLAAEIEGQAA